MQSVHQQPHPLWCACVQLVDEQRRFRHDNFEKLKAAFPGEAATGAGTDVTVPIAGADKARGSRSGRGGQQGKRPSKPQGPSVEQELEKIMQLVKDRHMDPIIVFSFSRA